MHGEYGHLLNGARIKAVKDLEGHGSAIEKASFVLHRVWPWSCRAVWTIMPRRPLTSRLVANLALGPALANALLDASETATLF